MGLVEGAETIIKRIKVWWDAIAMLLAVIGGLGFVIAWLASRMQITSALAWPEYVAVVGAFTLIAAALLGIALSGYRFFLTGRPIVADTSAPDQMKQQVLQSERRIENLLTAKIDGPDAKSSRALQLTEALINRERLLRYQEVLERTAQNGERLYPALLKAIPRGPIDGSYARRETDELIFLLDEMQAVRQVVFSGKAGDVDARYYRANPIRPAPGEPDGLPDAAKDMYRTYYHVFERFKEVLREEKELANEALRKVTRTLELPPLEAEVGRI